MIAMENRGCGREEAADPVWMIFFPIFLVEDSLVLWGDREEDAMEVEEEAKTWFTL